MIDAYTIGITLALNNGATEGIAAIRKDLRNLDKAVQSSSAGLVQLRVLAGSAVAGATTDVARLLATTSRAMAQIPRHRSQTSQLPSDTSTGGEIQSTVVPLSVPPAAPTPAVTPVAPMNEPPPPLPLSPAPPVLIPTGVSAAPLPRAETLVEQRAEYSAAPTAIAPATPIINVRTAAPTIPPTSPPIAPSVSPMPVLSQKATAPAVVPTVAPAQPRLTGGEAPRPLHPEFDYAALARELSPALASSLPRQGSVQPSNSSQAALLPPLPQPPVTISPLSLRWQSETAPEPARPSQAPAVPISAAPMALSAASPHSERHRVESTIMAPAPSVAPIGTTVAPERVARPLPSVAPQQPRAAPPPAKAELILDGASLGRWMDQRLARAVSRPPSGITGFDPRLTPVWSGASIGN